MRLIDADALIQYWLTPPANIGWDDEIEAVNNQPTVEAILKADYESHLKADLVAILDRVRAEIEQIADEEQKHDKKWAIGLRYAIKIIDKYKE